MTAILRRIWKGKMKSTFPYSKGCERTSRRLFGKTIFRSLRVDVANRFIVNEESKVNCLDYKASLDHLSSRHWKALGHVKASNMIALLWWKVH
jgi:hypothetical protein